MKANQILVALDGSNNSIRGLDFAINLAQQSNSLITGIFIFPPYDSIFQPIRYDTKLMQKEAHRIMNLAKTKSAQKSIVFKHKLTRGNPGEEIVKYAEDKRKNFSLIVIGSRGLGGTKEVFFGSVANYVLHKSKNPVLVIK